MSVFARTYRVVTASPWGTHTPACPWGSESDADAAMALEYVWNTPGTGLYIESRRFGITRVESGVIVVSPTATYIDANGTPHRNYA